MSRKLARESAYKLIFEYIFTQKPNKVTFEMFSEAGLSDADKKYLLETYKGVIDHYTELLDTISSFAENFSLERIFRADLAALLLAAYEMQYNDDIPDSVCIAEAVELVKIFSTEKSHQYVNGILSGFYKKLNP